MKIQELFETQNQTKQFNSYDEYIDFMESQFDGYDSFFFDGVTGADGNDYDVVVTVGDFSNTQGGANPQAAETPEEVYGSTEIDWNITLFGSADEMNNEYWVQSGEVKLTPNANQYIEDSLSEKKLEQDKQGNNERY